MQRLAGVLLAILTVFVAIGVVYTLRHHRTVTEAAQTPGPSALRSSTAPTGGPATSPSARPARPVVVAFLGDDWTAGVGASRRAARATTLLSTALRLRERNFGRSGAGYVAGGGFAAQVRGAVSAQPSVVVVLGGRNDVVARAKGTAAAARELFAALRAKLPRARLVAVAPMWGDSDAPKRLVSLRAAVRAAVTAAGGTYLDVADPITGHPELMAGAADPDDAGYRAVADAIEPQLAPLVN